MKTVLIVEDCEDYAENLRFVLEQAGYGVAVACDGHDGVDKAARLRPDLILMDVLMPDQDGVKTTMQIHEQEELRDIPVLFLTAVAAGTNMIMSVNGKDYPGISKMAHYKDIIGKIQQHMPA
ncbi:MAG: response regulator [Candidatus Omnitrophica bacterium]|nr:response regulator [Candidatus Omnitrophota bacterium]